MAANTPNIVIILADDLGYGDISCYNPASKIPTPNIDQLAAGGIRATDAHSPAAVCSPTRYGLLTGRYPWRGILKQGVVAPWGTSALERDRLNIPLLLRGYGYATGCFGKWHLGLTWQTKDGKSPVSVGKGLSNVDFTKPIKDGPTERGFDTWFGVDAPNFPPYVYIQDDKTVGIPDTHVEKAFQLNRPGPSLKNWNLERILPDVGRKAAQWITDQAKAKKPYFAYIPLPSPHYPIVPTKAWQGTTAAGAYGDFVAQTDAVIGEILQAIKDSGTEENTLVIFTSDNGPEVAGEVKPGVYERIGLSNHDSRGGLRGVKRDLWEGGHRVPFIAKWPAKLPSGTTTAETLCHTDIFATIAGIVGSPVPENAGEDSIDMVPALRGGAGGRRKVPTIHQSGDGKLAIRDGSWVYIDHTTGQNNGANGEPPALRTPDHGQPGELFNLSKDPREQTNLYAKERGRAARMKAMLEQVKSAGRSVSVTRGGRKDIDIGAKPLPGAEVLMDGSRQMLDDKWTYWQGPRFRSSLPIKWPVVPDPVDGGTCVKTDDPAAAGGVYGAADIVTKAVYRDFRLHIEFWIGGPGGNSGVYLQNRYEIQICDGDRTSHGLGAVINETPAPYHMYKGIGKWNSYDIVFRAARFAGGRMVEKPLTTIYLNGQRVHTNVRINQVWGGPFSGVDGGNDDGKGITDTPQGLKLQCEGHDVRYRNAWIKNLNLAKADTEF